jgi:hypothetical protein
MINSPPLEGCPKGGVATVTGDKFPSDAATITGDTFPSFGGVPEGRGGLYTVEKMLFS